MTFSKFSQFTVTQQFLQFSGAPALDFVKLNRYGLKLFK